MHRNLIFLTFFSGYILYACSSIGLVDNSSIHQNSYIQRGFVKPQAEQSIEHLPKQLSKRSIESWVGERFIFLPRPRNLEYLGYKLREDRGMSDRLSYAKYAGRIARVIAVTKDGIHWNIELSMEDTGEKLKARVFDHILDIAPLADIDYARAKWLGKTVWYKGGMIQKCKENLGSREFIRFKRFSPVKVGAIASSDLSTTPLRFFLETTSGEEGCIDLALTGTNNPRYFSATFRSKFEDFFLTEDPRAKYPWPDRIWCAIEERRLLLGMTKEQVMMSWGTPDSVHELSATTYGHSQWVYKGIGSSRTYLYFEGGQLTAIQD
jgi:hypothetical protein